MLIDWLRTNLDVDLVQFGSIAVHLAVAVVLGGLLGMERQLHGRWAGLRTHMSVAMGSAIFALAGIGVAPPDKLPDATRIIQGIAAGIGFLGAGTILKLSDQLEVKGLTTASSIWLSAAVGTAVGLGYYELALSGTLIALMVLALLRPVEKWLDRKAVPDLPKRADSSTANQPRP
jgi:putative Mg2+ transporter-C (MgtC) family protein